MQAHNEVTIGYQGICNPWKWKIDDGSVEKATGYKINWRKFDSGGAVMNAMASGDVHVAVAGSSPIAAGVTNGVDCASVLGVGRHRRRRSLSGS